MVGPSQEQMAEGLKNSRQQWKSLKNLNVCKLSRQMFKVLESEY